RDPTPHGLPGRSHGLLRLPQRAERIGHQVVLIQSAGDSPVGLELPEGIAVASGAIEGHAEDLTDGTGSAGHILGPAGRRGGLLGPSPLPQPRRSPGRRRGPLPLWGRRRRPRPPAPTHLAPTG